jgi:hypothetical protein
MQYAPINHGEVLRRANIPKRLAFCQTHIHDHVGSWVFMDAKLLHVGPEPFGRATHCWREDANPPSPGPITDPFTFHMYAAVAHGHKSSLVFVPPSPAEGSRDHKSAEHLNSRHYISMMGELRPSMQGWFKGGELQHPPGQCQAAHQPGLLERCG